MTSEAAEASDTNARGKGITRIPCNDKHCNIRMQLAETGQRFIAHNGSG